MRPIEIFYSYSDKDEQLREELETQLITLKREGIISGWHNRKVLAGDEMDQEIDSHLTSADIILLLVSPDFLASDYCYDVDVKRAMERHKLGEARVIPILLRPIRWQGTPFGKIQPLPKNAVPVTLWPNQDHAFFDVAEGIHEVVEQLKAKRAALLAPPILPENPPSPEFRIAESKDAKSHLELGTASDALPPQKTQNKPLPRIVQEIPRPAKRFQLKHTLSGHAKAVNSVAISMDGKILVSGSDDRSIRIWNVQTGELSRTLIDPSASASALSEGVLSVAISPDAKTLISGAGDSWGIHLWKIETGELLQTLAGHGEGCVEAIGISADGQTMVSGGIDRTVKVWSMPSGTLLQSLRGHEGYVKAVAISADGQTIASAGGDDESVRLWDLKTGKRRILLGHRKDVTGVALSADGRTLVSSSADRMLKVWNIETGKLLQNLAGHKKEVSSVALGADGKTVVSGSFDTSINIWNAESGKRLQTLAENENWILGVAISEDGRTIVSGCLDGTVRVWGLQTD